MLRLYDRRPAQATTQTGDGPALSLREHGCGGIPGVPGLAYFLSPVESTVARPPPRFLLEVMKMWAAEPKIDILWRRSTAYSILSTVVDEQINHGGKRRPYRLGFHRIQSQ
jgi:hypothetical protein